MLPVTRCLRPGNAPNRARRVHPPTHGKVTEVPDLVVRLHDRLPVGDHRRVHVRHRGERAAVEAECAAVAEMSVRGEIDGQMSLLRAVAEAAPCRALPRRLKMRRWIGPRRLGGSAVTDTARLYAPSAARNRDPILQALIRILPCEGTVLEVASGTGEHVAHFAAGAAWLAMAANRPGRGAAGQHRCMGGGAGQRAARPGAGRAGAAVAGSARRRGALHQHDPHRTAARDGRAGARRGPGARAWAGS